MAKMSMEMIKEKWPTDCKRQMDDGRWKFCTDTIQLEGNMEVLAT